MRRKRNIIRSIYIVFALIFLLVLGMDLYAYIQSGDNKKANEEKKKENKLVASQTISENNKPFSSHTFSDDTNLKIEEVDGNDLNETKKYFVAVYQNKIIVYLEDKNTVYEYTNIDTKELPLELRSKLSDGFFLNGEEELYHFLESYSS